MLGPAQLPGAHTAPAAIRALEAIQTHKRSLSNQAPIHSWVERVHIGLQVRCLAQGHGVTPRQPRPAPETSRSKAPSHIRWPTLYIKGTGVGAWTNQLLHAGPSCTRTSISRGGGTLWNQPSSNLSATLQHITKEQQLSNRVVVWNYTLGELPYSFRIDFRVLLKQIEPFPKRPWP